MDAEVVDYLLKYHFKLLPVTKQEALRSLLHQEKLRNIENDASRMRYQNLYERNGWISKNPDIAKLLQDGADAFRYHAATWLVENIGLENLLNNCPLCHRLARTPMAQQCRHCGFSWHSS